MQIKRLTLYQISLPLRFDFEHAQARYRESTNFVVRCELENGVCGWGEGIARSFVTGESSDHVFQTFQRLSGSLWKTDFSNPQEGIAFLKARGYFDAGAAEAEKSPAVSCAVELSLLDALGRSFGLSVAALLGAPARRFRPPFRVSGVLGLGWTLKRKLTLLAMRAYGLKQIKVKVSDRIRRESKRLEAVRRWVGPKLGLRLDANSAMSFDEADWFLSHITSLGLQAVEDPLRVQELEDLGRLRKVSSIPIILDESVRSVREAERFLKEGPFWFSVRIGKCGGLIPALEFIQWAESRDVVYQIGCHVGETGILSAAARQLLALASQPKYVEGFYDKWLLKENITRPSFFFGPGGTFEIDTVAPGLGVEVDERVVRKYCVREEGVGATR